MIYLYFMYSQDLMTQMANAMPKGAYPSINQSDINNFIMRVPNLDLQNEIIREISAHEAKNAEAKAVIDSSAERKQAILDKYLKDNK